MIDKIKKFFMGMIFAVVAIFTIDQFIPAQMTTNCLGDILFQGESPNGTITLDSFPLTADSLEISSVLIGDNPCVGFDTLPYGAYWFTYEVCSLADTTICKSTAASFYHMDIGTITADTVSICPDTFFTTIDTFFTIIEGANVQLDTIRNDTIRCGDLVQVIRTPINPDPSIYTLDPACTIDTFSSFVECACCTVDTILCDPAYVMDGKTYAFFIPNIGITDSIFWTGQVDTFSLAGGSLQVESPTAGFYYATTQIEECATTYVIEVFQDAVGCTAEIIIDTLNATLCNPTYKLSANISGTYLWSTMSNDSSIFVTGPGTYTLGISTGTAICVDTVTVIGCESNQVKGHAFVDIERNKQYDVGTDFLTEKKFFLIQNGVKIDSQTVQEYEFNTDCEEYSILIEDGSFNCQDSFYVVPIIGDTTVRKLNLTGRTIPANVAPDNIDSDFTPAITSFAHDVDVNYTQCFDTLVYDVGYWSNVSISGIVFGDDDSDDIFDPGETRIENHLVTLKNSSNIILATTTTDVNGFYNFTNLPPAIYNITFDPTPPTGYTGFVTPNTGNDAEDSDVSDIFGNVTNIQRYVCDDDISVSAGFM